MQGAATLDIVAGDEDGRVIVHVRNAHVGHNFPTRGAHPTQLVLTVDVKDEQGAVITQEQRSYRLSYLNAAGKPAQRDEAVKALEDTTLKPLETRTETFSFADSERARTVEAALVYHLIPEELSTELDPQEYRVHYTPVVIDRKTKSLKSGGEKGAAVNGADGK